MKICTQWVYRFRPGGPTNFGVSLEAYSQRKRNFMHLTYFKPTDVNDAMSRYFETMRNVDCHHHYLMLSINNLIELKKTITLDKDYKYLTEIDAKEITNMIAAVEHILDIKIDIIE